MQRLKTSYELVPDQDLVKLLDDPATQELQDYIIREIQKELQEKEATST